jgi:predicted unusual protein kinase regulating ubiquinone biosynthesis (AarF/ABC1/UbiB family)
VPPRSTAPVLIATFGAKEKPFEVLRTVYSRETLTSFFLRRPGSLAKRYAVFAQSWLKIKRQWEAQEALPPEERTRGAVLRSELAKLGPVAVKLGQTLSQRPDIIPEDACEELKSLQTSNLPFPNADAWRVIAQESGHRGPIAPGIVPDGCPEPEGKPLFASLSDEPIASASLGQVYKGLTHEGVEVAVKVQRPGAMRQVALDFAVFLTALDLISRAGWGNGDLDEIVDTVAAGVFEELDYRNEAKNGADFKRSMAFLGYVDVPRVLHQYSTGARVLVSEWVQGRHLDRLSRGEGLRMTYMAVEAVTASLVVTGLVHADPHEGNVMLADDGRLVFLDFGLMSRVEPDIMEAFASGIQALLNRDYEALVQAFIDRHHPPPPPTASHRFPPPPTAFHRLLRPSSTRASSARPSSAARTRSSPSARARPRTWWSTCGSAWRRWAHRTRPPAAAHPPGAPTCVARAPPRSLPAAR